MEKKNKKNICVRMNPQIINLLDEIAKREELKKVEIIENAIEQYIITKNSGGV